MRRRLRPARSQIRRNLLLPRRDIHAVDRPVEQRKRGLRLVVRDLVAGFVHAGEGEVAVLFRLAPLLAVGHHGGVARLAELRAVGVVQLHGDGLAAEPVADVVCVTVDQGDADAAVEDRFEILQKGLVDEVSGLLESEIYLKVCILCIIDCNTECLLYRWLVQVVHEAYGRGRVVEGVADI